MKRWIGLALLLVPFLASAASFWDGNAALQRGDASFEGGLYAESNSFEPGTQVLVQNLETGKSATVTVTKRIDGQSDILVLLSPLAASSVGISPGTLASVRVTVTSAPAVAASRQPSEQTYSQDPDLNPGVAYGDQAPIDKGTAGASETTTSSTGTLSAETGATASPSPSEVSLLPAEVPQTETVASEPAVTPEIPAEETQAVETPQADNASIIADATGRSPQKRVFLPPREDKTFAYQPSTQDTTQQAATDQATSAAPEITAVIGEPGATPTSSAQEDVALAEATPPEESQPQEIVGTDLPAPTPAADGVEVALAEAAAPEESTAREIVGAETPSPAPAAEGAEVALAAPEPSSEATPVGTEVTGPVAVPPAATPAAVVALAVPEAPSAERLPGTAVVAATGTGTTTVPRITPQVAPIARTDTYYLQLGAYATEKGAQDLAAGLSPTYPTLVLAPTSAGSRMYRVVVGPLNRAESGTLLLWFKFRGFPDAFVKQE